MKKVLLLVLTLGLSLCLVSCNFSKNISGKEITNEDINEEDVMLIEDKPVAEALDAANEIKTTKKLEEQRRKAKTCEDYYKDKIDTINEGLRQELAILTDVFKEAHFEVSKGDITYTYTFSDSYDSSNSSLFEQNYDSLISATKDAVKIESGCYPDTVTFRYFDSNGNELFEITK